MSEQSHAGLSIFVPTASILEKARKAEQSLQEHTHDMLELMGVSLLSLTMLAYQEKSKGGIGSDGIQWSPIQVGSLLARMRRVKHIGKLNQREKTHVAKVSSDPTRHGLHSSVKNARGHFRVNKGNAHNDTVFGQLTQAGILVSVKQSKSKKATFGAGHVFGIVKSSKSSTVRDALRKTISPSAGGYQIGIDKGLQQNTLMPGRSGDVGSNLLFNDYSVTIRAAMKYSKHFSRLRPIFPDELPSDWLNQIQSQVTQFGATIVQEAFKDST